MCRGVDPNRHGTFASLVDLAGAIKEKIHASTKIVQNIERIAQINSPNTTGSRYFHISRRYG